jgi:hypothetical protein
LVSWIGAPIRFASQLIVNKKCERNILFHRTVLQLLVHCVLFYLAMVTLKSVADGNSSSGEKISSLLEVHLHLPATFGEMEIRFSSSHLSTNESEGNRSLLKVKTKFWLFSISSSKLVSTQRTAFSGVVNRLQLLEDNNACYYKQDFFDVLHGERNISINVQSFFKISSNLFKKILTN